MNRTFTTGSPHISVRTFEVADSSPHTKSTPHFEELIWANTVSYLTIPSGEDACFIIEKDFLAVAAEKGGARLTAEGFDGEILPGNVLFLPGYGKEIRITAQNTAKIIIITIHGSLAKVLLACHMEKQEYFLANGLDAVQEAVHILLQCEDQPEEIASAVFHLLSRAHRKLKRYSREKGYPLLVETALGIIREEAATLESVREISDRLGITESHLSRLFSQSLGMSPGKVLRQQRIRYAQTLLTQPGMTISIAAQLAGFSGGDYFSRVFRNETGMTPSQYARLYQQDMEFETESRKIMDSFYL